MSQEIEVCTDGHRCENGSKCTENPYDEGAFYCDCDQANFDTVFAGLYCEHEATSYCTFTKEVSHISFCTNDGECEVEVSPDAAHLGCKCPEGYDGDHCQFVDGGKPEGWPYDGSDPPASLDAYINGKNTGDGGVHAGVVTIIVLAVLSFVVGVGYLIYRKKKSLATPLTAEKAIQDASDLSLDPDGGVLHASIRNMSDGTEDSASNDVVEEPAPVENGEVVEEEEQLEDIVLQGSAEDTPAPAELL